VRKPGQRVTGLRRIREDDPQSGQACHYDAVVVMYAAVTGGVALGHSVCWALKLGWRHRDVRPAARLCHLRPARRA
jgi:hypothetical protein